MIHSIVRPLQRCAALAAALVAGCVAVPPPAPPPALPARYAPVAWDDLPGYAADRVREAWPAVLVGCRKLVAAAATAPLWRAPCAAAERADANDENALRALLREHFSPYAVTGSDGAAEGLVTGYYEPTLRGSRVAGPGFPVPLYAVPDDLVVVDLASLHPELAHKRVRGRLDGRRVVPYWTREEIDAGKGAALAPLAFAADRMDAFFLEIQGSGRVVLPDGSAMRVGYADQNGQPYTPVARVLIERGEMTREEASMQAIRAWGDRHPHRVPALLRENRSVVFFREVPAPAPGTLEATIDGPLGALGVPLVAGRAIAVDPRAIPLGAPAWLATSHPSTGAALQRLVLAQDTGGAIRGAVRADLFWGPGDDAAEQAGRMKAPGRLWLLWPRGAPLPGADAVR
ncbi:MAG TPA: MltA domain-containing protein [Casimicrobiaceae bacterium]|nr:MltA domain-containing protein [Casimicrobiaceae bacterium]